VVAIPATSIAIRADTRRRWCVGRRNACPTTPATRAKQGLGARGSRRRAGRRCRRRLLQVASPIQRRGLVSSHGRARRPGGTMSCSASAHRRFRSHYFNGQQRSARIPREPPAPTRSAAFTASRARRFAPAKTSSRAVSITSAKRFMGPAVGCFGDDGLSRNGAARGAWLRDRERIPLVSFDVFAPSGAAEHPRPAEFAGRAVRRHDRAARAVGLRG